MPFKDLINEPEGWSDYSSLKQYLERRYGSAKMHIHRTILKQTGTAGAVEWEEKASETIAQIGKAEVAISLTGDADNASTNGKTYTLVYLDADGVSHTAVGTGTATLNGTPVAFVPPITDFYLPVSFTASAADANVNVTATTTGGGVDYATITKGTATTATDAQLIGVGSVNIAQKTNQVATDGGELVTLEYVNYLGVVKTAAIELDGTDTSTEVQLLDTTTGLTVKDFYRLRDLSFSMAATDEVLLVAPGGGTVYGAIKATYDHAIFTRYMCPTGRRAWIGKLCGNVTTANITAFDINFTPVDHSVKQVTSLQLISNIEFNIEPLFEVEPITDVYFTILGNTAVLCGNLTILEVEV